MSAGNTYFLTLYEETLFMTKRNCLVWPVIMGVFLGACISWSSAEETFPNTASVYNESTNTTDSRLGTNMDKVENVRMNNAMKLKINNKEFEVEWEENASVSAITQLVKKAPVIIRMSMYGGFEQGGPIGQSIPRNDKQTTTKAGDIVLYSGNQVVVFYGSNSWAYTRFGRITGRNDKELESLLDRGDVTNTLF